MTTRSDLLASIAHTIQDYRAGEISQPTLGHVDRWVQQFDAGVQEPLLFELDHVLRRTYINRATVNGFLGSLLTSTKLAGSDYCSFWRNVEFLKEQGGGNSQREMLNIFDVLLQDHCGFRVNDCGRNATVFIYLDDVLFSGNRALQDIKRWVQSIAPINAKIHVITMAIHSGGQYYAGSEIKKAAIAARKNISTSWWRMHEFEDKKYDINISDVLRPRHLGVDPLIEVYANSLRFPPTFRTMDSIGKNGIFSSESGRAILEQEFLKVGVKIRQLCPHLQEAQRPLGYSKLATLGFGSTIVTFRNCPNNTPLALWAGNPWYPLFPRKIN